MKERSEWEVWYEQYRGTELALLVTQLLSTLLRNGQCTCDDARSVPLAGDPRIRGGAVRALVRIGVAEKGSYKASDEAICHHRPIATYLLTNPELARSILNAVEKEVLGSRTNDDRQMLLAV